MQKYEIDKKKKKRSWYWWFLGWIDAAYMPFQVEVLSFPCAVAVTACDGHPALIGLLLA